MTSLLATLLLLSPSLVAADGNGDIFKKDADGGVSDSGALLSGDGGMAGPSLKPAKTSQRRDLLNGVKDKLDAPALSPAKNFERRHLLNDAKSKKALNDGGGGNKMVRDTPKKESPTPEQLRVRYARQLELKKGEDSWKDIARAYGSLKAMGEKDPVIAEKLKNFGMNAALIESMAHPEKKPKAKRADAPVPAAQPRK